MSRVARSDLYRKLPSVDEVMRVSALAPLIQSEGQAAVADAVRTVLSRLRHEIAAGNLEEADDNSVRWYPAPLFRLPVRPVHDQFLY